MKQLTRQQFDIVITAEENNEVQILQYVIGRLNNLMARVRQTANTQEYMVQNITLDEINTILEECYPHQDKGYNGDVIVIDYTDEPTKLQGLINTFKLYILPYDHNGINVMVDLTYKLDFDDDDDRVVCYQDLKLTDIIELYTQVVNSQTNRLLKLYA